MKERLAAPLLLAAVATVALAGALLLRPGYRALALDAYVLAIGGLLLLGLVNATRTALPPPERSRLDPERRRRAPAEPPLPELERVEREVALASSTAFDVHYRLRPLLREVAAHRLTARRGIDLDRTPAAAREALGEDAFACAWAAGRALRLEEAVAEAMALAEQVAHASLPCIPGDAAPADPTARFGLTPREVEVLRLLAEGRSDREIGQALFVSHRTAMFHVSHILAKLGADSRTAAATLALRHRLV